MIRSFVYSFHSNCFFCILFLLKPKRIVITSEAAAVAAATTRTKQRKKDLSERRQIKRHVSEMNVNHADTLVTTHKCTVYNSKRRRVIENDLQKHIFVLVGIVEFGCILAMPDTQLHHFWYVGYCAFELNRVPMCNRWQWRNDMVD